MDAAVVGCAAVMQRWTICTACSAPSCALLETGSGTQAVALVTSVMICQLGSSSQKAGLMPQPWMTCSVRKICAPSTQHWCNTARCQLEGTSMLSHAPHPLVPPVSDGPTDAPSPSAQRRTKSLQSQYTQPTCTKSIHADATALSPLSHQQYKHSYLVLVVHGQGAFQPPYSPSQVMHITACTAPCWRIGPPGWHHILLHCLG